MPAPDWSTAFDRSGEARISAFGQPTLAVFKGPHALHFLHSVPTTVLDLSVSPPIVVREGAGETDSFG